MIQYEMQYNVYLKHYDATHMYMYTVLCSHKFTYTVEPRYSKPLNSRHLCIAATKLKPLCRNFTLKSSHLIIAATFVGPRGGWNSKSPLYMSVQCNVNLVSTWEGLQLTLGSACCTVNYLRAVKTAYRHVSTHVSSFI